MPTKVRRPRRVVMRRDALQRIAREKLGLTSDTALAERLGVDRGDFSRYLHGRRQPTVDIIGTIIDLFGEPFEELFEVQVVDDPAPRFANVA